MDDNDAITLSAIAANDNSGRTLYTAHPHPAACDCPNCAACIACGLNPVAHDGMCGECIAEANALIDEARWREDRGDWHRDEE